MAPQAEENRLLAALPREVVGRLEVHLEIALLKLGEGICEPGRLQEYVYFPIDSIVSLLYFTDDGTSTEIAMIGNEGIVGVASFLGGDTTPGKALVQSAGRAYRLGSHVLRNEFEAGGALKYLLLRFTQALLTQIAQTAVCNRYHSVDQQLCRWLLLSLDRLPSNELRMTQDLISKMLGVRREGVTEAACRLQTSGLIHYHRGRILIMDRPGLEARVCECYDIVRREYRRLLGEIIAPRSPL